MRRSPRFNACRRRRQELGQALRKTLEKLKVPYWQDGRYWHMRHCDALIVASSSESHYEVARTALGRKIPVLIEKPAATTSEDVQRLIDMGGIVFVGHTRLYSPAWREYKSSLARPERIEAWAGGVTPTNPDALLNWGVHLAAMSWDLGCDPEEAAFHITEERRPLRFMADGHEFQDPPTDPAPLEVLVTEFLEAVELGKPNNAGLHLALKTIQYVEAMRVPG
jgi:predicted dehydrogenase